MFFNITEWLITVPLFLLLDKTRAISKWVYTLAQSVAICHIIASLEDQGFFHMIVNPFNTGIYLILRDLFLLISDLFPVIILFIFSKIPTCKQAVALVFETIGFYVLYSIIRLAFPFIYQ